MDKKEWSRRRFLKFMGRGMAVAYTLPLLNTLESCTGIKSGSTGSTFQFEELSPSLADELRLTKGLEYDIFIKWGDLINDKGEQFGFNNDYIAFIPFKDKKDEGYLWVNHEYPDPLFVSGFRPSTPKTKEQALKELEAVGGSILHVKNENGKWRIIPSEKNRRITGLTPIPIIAEREIEGSSTAIGTFGNCAGGITPWGTILTCEENTEEYYGRSEYYNLERIPFTGISYYGYNQFFSYPPEHYGWVVEVDPETGNAKKLTALGRFAHECATVRLAADGRCVVYTADDVNDEHLYKFIADTPGSLEKGSLYVADLTKGKWRSLMMADQNILKGKFRDQTDVLIRAREAAKLVGATPLDRPEDIKIDPATGAVVIALSNNIPKGNYFGSLLRIMEKDNDPLAMEFRSDTFLAGSPETGFACPDNLAFDPKGNLWMTTDMSGSLINKEPYIGLGNNSLMFIPMSGENAGKPVRVITAPVDAELTGPCFSPDGRTLFLAVQHPGERTSRLDQLTSNWPEGNGNIPKPSVVAIYGEALDALMS